MDAGLDVGGGRDAGSCPPPLGAAVPRAASPTDYPMDDVLRVSDIQAKGTHNSYHIEPEAAHPDWMYTHAPLDVQLDAQGVRKLELDVSWSERCGRFEVYHIGFLDELTTCRLFTECLATIRRWSDAHPGHHPIFVQIETKDTFDADDAPARYDSLDAEIRSVFPEELLITPDLVRGAHLSVAEAIATDGWPTLGEVRGRVLFFLDRGGEQRDLYLVAHDGLAGRVLFVDGSATDSFAVVHVRNDPGAQFDEIQALVRAGHLVRTRADDDSTLARALDSGAHATSTNWPVPVDGHDFSLTIPGGTPSRCNPVSAPAGCTPEAIEHPSRL
jgi:hypothetical protein